MAVLWKCKTCFNAVRLFSPPSRTCVFLRSLRRKQLLMFVTTVPAQAEGIKACPWKETQERLLLFLICIGSPSYSVKDSLR